MNSLSVIARLGAAIFVSAIAMVGIAIVSGPVMSMAEAMMM